MKKFFTLIAVALCAVAANAEIVTDVSSFKNYIFADADGVAKINNNSIQTKLEAGKRGYVCISLKHDGAAQSLGFTVEFPEGFTPVNFGADQSIWKSTVDDFGGVSYDLAAQKNTITGSSLKTGLLGGGSECNYNANEGVVGVVIVDVPENATSPVSIKIIDGEVSVTKAYQAANNLEYAYEKHTIECSIPLAGADAIVSVKADGTEADAPVKKIVNGQLVIENANGTFNAAGAQVK